MGAVAAAGERPAAVAVDVAVFAGDISAGSSGSGAPDKGVSSLVVPVGMGHAGVEPAVQCGGVPSAEAHSGAPADTPKWPVEALGSCPVGSGFEFRLSAVPVEPLGAVPESRTPGSYHQNLRQPHLEVINGQGFVGYSPDSASGIDTTCCLCDQNATLSDSPSVAKKTTKE